MWRSAKVLDVVAGIGASSVLCVLVLVLMRAGQLGSTEALVYVPSFKKCYLLIASCFSSFSQGKIGKGRLSKACVAFISGFFHSVYRGRSM